MKQLTSYNRVAGYLNKLFDLPPFSPRPAHTVTFPCVTIHGFPPLAIRMKSTSARESPSSSLAGAAAPAW